MSAKLRKYAKVARRISDLLALCSIGPLILTGRASNNFRRYALVKAKEDEKAEKTKKDKKTEPAKEKKTGKTTKEKEAGEAQKPELAAAEDSIADPPLGWISIALLVASEVVGAGAVLCPELAVGEGHLGEETKFAMKRVRKTLESFDDKAASKFGFVDSATMLLAEAVRDNPKGPLVWKALHSVVMLVVLLTLLIHLLMSNVTRRLELRQFKVQGFFRFAAILIPVVAYCYKNAADISKEYAKLDPSTVQTLQIGLRSVGLLVARRGKTEEEDPPSAFFAFQAASLLAQVGVKVCEGSLDKAFQDLQVVTSVAELFGNAAFRKLGPPLLASVWTLLRHLHKSVLLAMLTLAVVWGCYPERLAQWWPIVEQQTGLASGLFDKLRNRDSSLSHTINLLYTMITVLTVLCGGSLGMASMAIVSSLIVRIHGLEDNVAKSFS